MALIQTVAKQVYANQEQLRSQRDQVAENAARQAFFSTEHRTTGSGSISVKEPIKFDCTFLERPAFFFGPEIVKLESDHKHWRYPLSNAGVWKWVSEPTPEAKAAKSKAFAAALRAVGTSQGSSGVDAANSLDNSALYSEDELLYTGAYVYFVVTVDPILRPRTDGSDLAVLQTQLAATTNTADRAILTALVKEANEALYLTAHPPQPVINFSLTFMGKALKQITHAVTDGLHSDPSLQPNVPPTVTGTANGTSGNEDGGEDDGGAGADG